MEAAKLPQEDKGLKALASDAAGLSRRSQEAIENVRKIFGESAAQTDNMAESVNVINELVAALISETAQNANQETLLSLTQGVSETIFVTAEKSKDIKNSAELLKSSLARFLNKY
jgi:hypothetical protein